MGLTKEVHVPIFTRERLVYWLAWRASRAGYKSVKVRGLIQSQSVNDVHLISLFSFS